VFAESGPFRFLAPVESFIFKCAGVDSKTEMHWTSYCGALLMMNLLGLIALFGIQLLQGHLPLNPQHLKGVEPFLALNTAVSFVTNTNWQAYSGESPSAWQI
jgi:K+-transporting ATPase ATPase A chain